MLLCFDGHIQARQLLTHRGVQQEIKNIQFGLLHNAKQKSKYEIKKNENEN